MPTQPTTEVIHAVYIANADCDDPAEPGTGSGNALATGFGGRACCAVKAIDPKASMATLQGLKTGQTFQQKVDPNKLKNLKVGQQVDRNIGTPAR